MSLGLTDARGLPIPAPPSEVTGTPSITIRGSFDAFSEAAPRIRMVADAPGWPEAGVTCRPDTLPRSILIGRRDGSTVDFVSFYGYDRSCHIAFLDSTVTDDHYLLKKFGIILHHNPCS